MGEQDFSSFCKASSEAKDKNCEIFISKWELNNEKYQYHIVGNRFLHHMVRFLVGTMIEVSRGRYSINDFKDMLTLNNTGCFPLCAPAKGLFLKNVYY